MTPLAQWLHYELDRRDLEQISAATESGGSRAGISDNLFKGHPRNSDMLFRLADYLGVSRADTLSRLADTLALPPLDIMIQAGLVRTGEQIKAEIEAAGDTYLFAELLHEFRQVPDEWKEEAVRQIAMFRRLAELPPARFIGEDQEA